MIIAVILIAVVMLLRSNAGFTGASLVTLMSFGDILSGCIVMHWTKLETSSGAKEGFGPSTQWSSLKTRKKRISSRPRCGQLRVKSSCEEYDAEDLAEKPNLALSNVHISIAPGEKVFICGRTGGGKSSIIALLFKLLDPIEEIPGQVYIDSTPVHRMDRPTLRLRMTSIPHDAVFLPDGTTFQQNVDPFNIANLTDCRAVPETVDMRALIEQRGGLNARMNFSTFSHASVNYSYSRSLYCVNGYELGIRSRSGAVVLKAVCFY